MITLTHARSKGALISALNLLSDFSSISGLGLNDTKREALWIGSSIENGFTLNPGCILIWPKIKVKLLEVWLFIQSEIMSANYSRKLEKIMSVVNTTGYRKYHRLMLMGKIEVLKTLVT